jgi:hypothetical protein
MMKDADKAVTGLHAPSAWEDDPYAPRAPVEAERVTGWTGGVRKVAIRDLLRDQRYQVRRQIDSRTVQRYALALKAGGDFPPVKVAIVRGAPILVDGWHRVAAHEQVGITEVMAEGVVASRNDAAWMAAEANLTHGLPLKPAEKMAAFRVFITARKHRRPDGSLLSLREISRAMGGAISHEGARKWLMKYYPKIAEEYGPAEPHGSGGHRGRPGPPEPVEIANDGIRQAAIVAKGELLPFERWELHDAVRALLQAIEAGGPMEEPIRF